MTFCRRALAPGLGLFLCLVSHLAAQDTPGTASGLEEVNIYLSGRAGTLWVEDDGAALYWHSGMTLTYSPPGFDFNMGIDIGRIFSNLNRLELSLFGLRANLGVDSFWGGFHFSAGYFSHQDIRFVRPAARDIVLSNEGGQGFFLSARFPLRFAHLTIVPSILYGEGRWGNGELYYFFGKPGISALWLYGISFRLDPHDRFSAYEGRFGHELSFNFFGADIAIYNNEEVLLFRSPLRAAFFFYGLSLEKETMSFSARIGGLHAYIPLHGELNASNQNYFLFPFLFYRVSGSLDILAGFAYLGFRHERRIFRYGIRLGAIHTFSARNNFNIHYQQKRLFGGREGFDNFYMDIEGLGAAFLLLDAGFPSLPLGANRQLSLGLQRIFLVPWGYENLLPSGRGGGGGGTTNNVSAPSASTIRTLLLSGLSFQASLRW